MEKFEKKEFKKFPKPEKFNFSPYPISTWVIEGIKNSEAVAFANTFGKVIKDGNLTTSQIRNVFGEMRRIQLNGYIKEKSSFILLLPKLAYAVKRQTSQKAGDGIKDFYEFFKTGYDSINFNDDQTGAVNFKNFMELTEAVLAYHKFHGGN